MPFNKIRVLCPNGRRQNVNIDANTSILWIRENVCKKQGFDENCYQLKFHKRFLDDSSNVRFENLPNNSELELVKSERTVTADSDVTVVLQREDGIRDMKLFVPSDSLWDVIKRFEVSECSGETQPACRYLMKNIIGEDNLRNTTLRQLGLTDGKVCIRYMEIPIEGHHDQAHCVQDLPKEEQKAAEEESLIKDDSEEESGTSTSATELPDENTKIKSSVIPSDSHLEEQIVKTHDQTEQLMKTEESFVEKDEIVKIKNISLEAISEKDLAKTKDEDILAATASACSSEGKPSTSKLSTQDSNQTINIEAMDYIEEVIEFLDENGSVVLNPNVSSSEWDPPDDFYNLTVEDARLIQQRLTEQVQKENTLMLRGEKKPHRSYDICCVRIQMPPGDGYILQTSFLSTDTIADVMEFVRLYLNDTNLNFYLYTTPPKLILDGDTSLTDYNLGPSCLLHLGVEEESGGDGILLDPGVRDKAVSIHAYNRKFRREIKPDFKHTPAEPSHQQELNKPDVPKWFKLGRK